MKPAYFSPLLSFLILLAPASGNAADSMVRVSCEGTNEGAEVFLNGKLKGECPIDMQVPPGPLKLTARKRIDADKENRWEQEANLGDGVVKKFEVKLFGPYPTPEAMQRYVEEMEKLFEPNLRKAEAGDVEAMLWLAGQYQHGGGVIKNEVKSVEWLRKAVAAGSVDAMAALGVAYFEGRGVQKNKAEGDAWYRKAADKGNAPALRYYEARKKAQEMQRAVDRALEERAKANSR